MAPNAEIKAFHYFGHDFNTSKADIAAGDWATLSTMLYLWATFEYFPTGLVGPLAIFGKGSIGIFDMVKGVVGALVLAPNTLVSSGVL